MRFAHAAAARRRQQALGDRLVHYLRIRDTRQRGRIAQCPPAGLRLRIVRYLRFDLANAAIVQIAVHVGHEHTLVNPFHFGLHSAPTRRSSIWERR